MWSQDDPRYDKIKPVQPAEPQTPNRKSTEGIETHMAQLGRSVCVKGEITGSEDLTVDGQVDGRILLPEHVLTVGPNATVCTGHLRRSKVDTSAWVRASHTHTVSSSPPDAT